MECPKCFSKTTVIDSDLSESGLQVKRRRKCLNKNCQLRFNTIEVSEDLMLPVFKSLADFVIRAGINTPTNRGSKKTSKKGKTEKQIGGLFPTSGGKNYKLTKK